MKSQNGKEEKLHEINHAEGEMPFLSTFVWLLWLQINKANWQFIYLLRHLQVGLWHRRRLPSPSPPPAQTNFIYEIVRRNFGLTLTYLFWLFFYSDVVMIRLDLCRWVLVSIELYARPKSNVAMRFNVWKRDLFQIKKKKTTRISCSMK